MNFLGKIRFFTNTAYPSIQIDASNIADDKQVIDWACDRVAQNVYTGQQNRVKFRFQLDTSVVVEETITSLIIDLRNSTITGMGYSPMFGNFNILGDIRGNIVEFTRMNQFPLYKSTDVPATETDTMQIEIEKSTFAFIPVYRTSISQDLRNTFEVTNEITFYNISEESLKRCKGFCLFCEVEIGSRKISFLDMISLGRILEGDCVMLYENMHYYTRASNGKMNLSVVWRREYNDLISTERTLTIPTQNQPVKVTSKLYSMKIWYCISDPVINNTKTIEELAGEILNRPVIACDIGEVAIDDGKSTVLNLLNSSAFIVPDFQKENNTTFSKIKKQYYKTNDRGKTDHFVVINYKVKCMLEERARIVIGVCTRDEKGNIDKIMHCVFHMEVEPYHAEYFEVGAKRFLDDGDRIACYVKTDQAVIKLETIVENSYAFVVCEGARSGLSEFYFSDTPIDYSQEEFDCCPICYQNLELYKKFSSWEHHASAPRRYNGYYFAGDQAKFYKEPNGIKKTTDDEDDDLIGNINTQTGGCCHMYHSKCLMAHFKTSAQMDCPLCKDVLNIAKFYRDFEYCGIGLANI